VVGFEDPRRANRYIYAGQDPVNMTDPKGAHFLSDFADDWYTGAQTIWSNRRPIMQIGAGAGAIAGGMTIAGTCLVATRGLAATHCTAMGGSLTVGGGVLISTAFDD